MTKSLQYMLKELRVATKMNSSRSDIDDGVMVNALDASQDAIGDVMLQSDKYLFSTYYDLTLDGSERYYLPDLIPYDYDEILAVNEANGNYETETVNTIWGDRLNYVCGSSELYLGALVWSLRGQYLEFPGKPGSGTMRVWYTRRPKGFFYITATSGSTTTAVVGITATKGEIIPTDDYYNGMMISAGLEVRRITDFDAYSGASAHTITFSPALQTAVGSSTVVSMVSPLPTRHHQLIIDEAARRIRTGLDDDDTQYIRMNMDSVTRMNMTMAHRTGGPEYVRKITR